MSVPQPAEILVHRLDGSLAAVDSVGRSRGQAAALLGIVGLLTVAATLALASQAALGIGFVAFAPLTFAAIAALVFVNLPSHGARRFGPANAVTSLRAGMTAIVGGLAVDASHWAEPDGWLAWTAAGLALAILSLDGIDGWLARRTDLASRFGARYDMEIDALLILFLSVLAFQLGKAGAFVWLIGLLRYGFWLAGKVWPVLDGQLAPSRFRKAVCVVQIVVLCALAVPPVVPPLSPVLAAFALALLCASFGRDIVSLLTRPARATA